MLWLWSKSRTRKISNFSLPIPLPVSAPILNRVAKPKATQVELVTLPQAAALNGRFASLSPDKLRGGYYTPNAVADWLACWALRRPTDSFLEPSCGNGAILAAGIRRLQSLGTTRGQLQRLVQGVEIAPSEADAARDCVSGIAGAGARQVVETGDFFAWTRATDGRKFTAVLGNPPFIRYQSFPEPSRGRAMGLMERAGLRPNKLTNIWVPFVVAATEALENSGRLRVRCPC